MIHRISKQASCATIANSGTWSTTETDEGWFSSVGIRSSDSTLFALEIEARLETLVNFRVVENIERSWIVGRDISGSSRVIPGRSVRVAIPVVNSSIACDVLFDVGRETAGASNGIIKTAITDKVSIRSERIQYFRKSDLPWSIGHRLRIYIWR
jgi:hypothetical protein